MTAAPPGEGRKVVLPLPGGGSKGGGGREGQDIGPPETEHGRAIYCNTNDSGYLRGGGAEVGDTCPTVVVGAAGNRLDSGEGKDGSVSGTGRSKRGGKKTPGSVAEADSEPAPTPGWTAGGTG